MLYFIIDVLFHFDAENRSHSQSNKNTHTEGKTEVSKRLKSKCNGIRLSICSKFTPEPNKNTEKEEKKKILSQANTNLPDQTNGTYEPIFPLISSVDLFLVFHFVRDFFNVLLKSRN